MTMYGTGAATAPRTSQNGQTGHGRAPAVAMPKTRRRTGLAVVGVVLLLLGALAGVRLVASAGDRLDVLSVARDVPLGATITGADLHATYVSVDPGIATVLASDKAAIVGQVAATHLVAGSLLAHGEVAKAGPPAAGQVLVPLAVPSTRLPAVGLHAGDRLMIVDTPVAGESTAAAAAARTFEVTVARVGPPDLNGVTVVDVISTPDAAPSLATRAASGQFALVVLPVGAAGAP